MGGDLQQAEPLPSWYVRRLLDHFTSKGVTEIEIDIEGIFLLRNWKLLILRVAAKLCAQCFGHAIPELFGGGVRENFFYSAATGGIFLYSCTKKIRLGNCDRRNYIWQKRASTCHCAVQCTQFHVVPAKECCSWPARCPLDVPTYSMRCLKCPNVRTFTCNGQYVSLTVSSKEIFFFRIERNACEFGSCLRRYFSFSEN